MSTFVGHRAIASDGSEDPEPPPTGGPTPPVDPPPPPETPGGWAGSWSASDAAAAPGDVIYVPAATYTEVIDLDTDGVTWFLEDGVIIDLSGEGIAVQAAGVNINGDDISFIGEGRITGSDGAAYKVDGDRVTVTVEVDHCIEEGYVWHGSDGLMLNGSNHDNNESGEFWDSSEQGAGKANCDRLTIDGVHVYNIGLGADSNDAGQGLWYDSISSPPNSRFSSGIVRNCTIHDVFYAGLMFEVSDGGEFYNNVIHHCGNTPSGSGFWGAGILISSSRNVRVYDNVLAYNDNSGVRVLCQTRTDKPGVTTGVAVYRNTFIRNGRALYVNSDDSGVAASMFAPGSGNVAYQNIYNEDDVEVHWNGTTHTSLATINLLPGGGGNTTITEAAADAILATYGITP